MPRPGALIAACLGIALLAAPAARPQADIVLFNGPVYTVDPARPLARAVAIASGKILAVGEAADIQRLARDGARRIDLEGRAVVPGFIDAHGHLAGLGAAIEELDFIGTTRYEQIIAMVAAKAASLPKGEWITGRGWDQNDWPEKDFPHHSALSAAVPDHPVYLTRVDGHAGFANARALEIAGLSRETPDPPGGRIIRDAQGDPTGVLIDAAQGLVRRHVPEPSKERQRRALLLAAWECLKHGLTSVHDAGVSGFQIDLYRELIDSGEFDLRVYALISARDRAALEKHFREGPLLDYGGRLTVRAVKAYADGALGSRGAALLADYNDEPGNRGLLITARDDLQRLTEEALRAGFQVCTHAIGDRGNREVLDAYEAALKAVPQTHDPRLRIEHAQVVALDDIPRFAALGVIPSMQATHATSDMYWAEDRVGPERIKGAYAWRRFLDAGCRIANGSDFPVENVNPLWGFYAAITRQDHDGRPEGGWRPEERMTREEALRSFTLDAAYAAFQENELGSLEAGKLADLVVLSHDIMKIPPSEILQTRVELTIVAGKVVYSYQK